MEWKSTLLYTEAARSELGPLKWPRLALDGAAEAGVEGLGVFDHAEQLVARHAPVRAHDLAVDERPPRCGGPAAPGCEAVAKAAKAESNERKS